MSIKKVLGMLTVCVALFLAGCQSTIEEPNQIEEPKVIPISAIIAESALQYPATNDLFYYNVYDDYIAITKYLGDDTFIKKGDGYTVPSHIKIPDTIDGLPVYVIGSGAFEDALFIEVEISKNVVIIGADAFSNCQNLEKVIFTDVGDLPDSVTLGEGVVTIGQSAFSNCVKLADITLPDSVETIGASAFSNCTSLEKINVPALVTYIPNGMCSGCKKLRAIYITDSVVEIEDSAFGDVANDAQIYGGVYSQSAHYAANHFMLFVINREKEEIKTNAPTESAAVSDSN